MAGDENVDPSQDWFKQHQRRQRDKDVLRAVMEQCPDSVDFAAAVWGASKAMLVLRLIEGDT